MTFDDIVAAVLTQFQAPRATVEGWVDSRHKRMVADSKWRKEEREVAETVDGVARYDLSADIVDVRKLRAGDVPYDVVRQDDLWSVRNPLEPARLVGPGGVCAQAFSDSGQAQVELYPVPTSSGDTITVLAAVQAATMQSGSSPIIPEDFHDALLSGAIADGYKKLDERWDLAVPHEQEFSNAIVALTKRAVSRVGSGPTRARQYRRDFR